MTKKIFFLFFAFLLISNHLQAEDSDSLYHILKEKFNLADNRESFYVFAVNPNGGSSTIGHIINMQHRIIKEHSACKDILFVLEDNIARGQIRGFFNELLKVPYDEVGAQNILIDSDLYRSIVLDKRSSTDILYFYNKQRYYHKILKHSDPRDCGKFPYDRFGVELVSKIMLDTNYYQTGASFYQKGLRENELIQWADVGGRVSVLNKHTGEFKHIFDKDMVSIIELYAKHINNAPEAIEKVKQGIQWLEKNNRPAIPIYNIYTQNDAIYICYAIQVLEILKEDMIIPFKGGEDMKIDKGTGVHKGYRLLAKCDDELRIVKNYYDEGPLENKGKEWFFPKFDAIDIKGDSLWVINSATKFEESGALSEKYSDALTRYYINDKESKLEIAYTAKPSMLKDLSKKSEYILFDKLISWQEKLWIWFDTDKHLYAIQEEKPYYTLKAIDSIPEIENEVYSSFYGDTTQTRSNYITMGMSNLYDNEYLLMAYYYQNHLVMDFINTAFETSSQLQIPNEGDFKALYNPFKPLFDGENIYTQDLDKEDGYYYLYHYRIVDKQAQE
ncbi:MAG: hypothetical protein JJT94_17640 [Bernardetiaceae bacterium]|nr:hypothetical protein [Bernardetiaceae bacterium]